MDCIARPLCGSNSNDGILCGHYQARCDTIFEMDHVLERHFDKNIAVVLSANVSAHLKALKLTMFASFFDLNLQKMGTELVRQMLRALIAVATFAEKDHHVQDLIYTLYRTGKCFFAPINGGQLLQTVLNTARRDSVARADITIPSVPRSTCSSAVKLWYRIIFKHRIWSASVHTQQGRSFAMLWRTYRWRGRLLQKLPTLPNLQSWFFRTLCAIWKRNDF